MPARPLLPRHPVGGRRGTVSGSGGVASALPRSRCARPMSTCTAVPGQRGHAGLDRRAPSAGAGPPRRDRHRRRRCAGARGHARVRPGRAPGDAADLAAASLDAPPAPGDLVVLAAAGSRSPAERATGGPRRCRCASTARCMSGTAPRRSALDHSWTRCARAPGRRIVAASYLLAPGHFHDRVLACGADDVTDPLLDDRARTTGSLSSWCVGMRTAGWLPRGSRDLGRERGLFTSSRFTTYVHLSGLA